MLYVCTVVFMKCGDLCRKWHIIILWKQSEVHFMEIVYIRNYMFICDGMCSTFNIIM